MQQIWRQMYFRLSLLGGGLSLFLIVVGASARSPSWFSEPPPLKPQIPSPVAVVCEKKLKESLKYPVFIPEWCHTQQLSQDHSKPNHIKIF